MPRDRDTAYLHDIVSASRYIIEFTNGMDHAGFYEDVKTQSAVIHQVLIIGEAVKRVSQTLREKYPDIPWSKIARTRDMLIHHYEGIDPTEVWKIIDSEIPSLLKSIELLLKLKQEGD